MAHPTAAPHTIDAPTFERSLILAYGTGTYVLFLVTFLAMIGFVGGFGLPRTLDSGDASSGWSGLLVNAGLLGLFAVQHTIMARPAFKRWWVRFVPEAAERTTFVFITCAILIAMVLFWQPFPDIVWHVEGAAAIALWAACGLGWLVVLLSTFLIDHFELFGIKQAIGHFRGRPVEAARFQERWFYKSVRHPLMLGFLIAFWATPTMSQGHLLFALLTTGYILIALVIEESTLVELHGDAYQDYQQRVPKLIPSLRRA